MTFTKNSAGAPKITDTNNYYSFGLNHTGGNGLNSSNFGSLYSYKYNEKELQETGMFDYGWRQYMPDLGRWNGIDQLAEAYHMASPYAYVMNNPISFLDPDGRDVKPTRDGYEFSGSDLQNVMGYLQGGGSARKLVSSLSAWEKEESGGDFWGYFGSWNAWGATGGDVGGNLYASTWGDGAMGATPYDIQEIVFTKTKITNIQSISDWKEQGALAARQPGRAQMIGGVGDFLGIFDIGGQVMSTWKPENRYLAMGGGIIAAVALKKPGLISTELQVEKQILNSGDLLRIENAATRINKPISVVGSRASGTAKAYSDWDYVIEGLNSREWSKIKNSIPGARSIIDNTPRNIDLFKKVDISRPYITIHPR